MKHPDYILKHHAKGKQRIKQSAFNAWFEYKFHGYKLADGVNYRTNNLTKINA